MCLSDRMSRSEMPLLLPSPPTAMQAMMADIANGIVETKNLNILAVCPEWACRTLAVAVAVWSSRWVVLQWDLWVVSPYYSSNPSAC